MTKWHVSESKTAKNYKVRTITKNKGGIWLLFPIYYLTNFVFLSYQISHLISMHKRFSFIKIIHPAMKGRTSYREGCSHLLFVKRQFILNLLCYNDKRTFISLTLSLSPPLFSCQALDIQSNFLTVCLLWALSFLRECFRVLYRALFFCVLPEESLSCWDGLYQTFTMHSKTVPLTGTHILTFNQTGD